MINLFSIYVFFIILCGHSFIFKYFFFRSKKITNLDLIYGFYFILVLAIFFNFFIPLKFLFYPLIITGIISFIYNIRYFKLRFNYYIFIILGIFYISLANGIAIDSLVYHLQIIQKFNFNPIILGFFNLDLKYGLNTPWHLLMSIFYFENHKVDFIYYLNLIVLSILLYEGFSFKNKNFSFLFLLFSIFFLFFYSIIHPSGNGIILTLLGSPDTDTSATFFCILTIYIFLDKKKSNLLRLPFFILVCFLCKISYMALFLLLINPFFFSKKNIILIMFPIILWIIRNLLISGCIVYPFPISCFNFEWANIYSVKTFYQIATGYSRDWGLKLNYMNVEYTINSFAWFKPWLFNYFLKNSLIQITILSIFLGLLTYLKNLKNSFKFLEKRKFFYFILFLLMSFVIWFKAPDTRYIMGIIISINAYFILYVYFGNQWLFKIPINFRLILIFLFFSLIFKNYKNLNYFNKSIKNEFVNYNFQLIDPIIGVYTPVNGQCVDMNFWCVYEGNSISIKKKFYLLQVNKNE
jgi:hypothetical protein